MTLDLRRTTPAGGEGADRDERAAPTSRPINRQKTSRDWALSDRAYSAIAETFRALADPTRARIIHLLASGESSVNDLASNLTVTPSAVSHQLRMLRQMGLVRFRREGQQALYALDDPHVAILFRAALEHVGDYLKGTSAHRDSVSTIPAKAGQRHP